MPAKSTSSQQRPTTNKCGSKKSSDGQSCLNPAGFKTSHIGFGNCHLHGGATPNGGKHAEKERTAWQERLVNGIDPHLSNVESIALGSTVEARTRLAASKDWLDRAGVKQDGDASAEGVEIIIKWPDRA